MVTRAVRRTSQDRARDDLLAMLERRGIHDRCVLAGMSAVPCPPGIDAFHIAAMLQALGLRGDEHILAIRAPAYLVAVLAKLVGEVREADDIANGAPAGGPYDAIVMCADGVTLSRALVDQLAEDGRLVMSIDGAFPIAIQKRASGEIVVIDVLGPGACTGGGHADSSGSHVP